MQSIEILIVIVLIQNLAPATLWARFGMIQNDAVRCRILKSGVKSKLATPHFFP
jgi:hypothetical protein